MNTSADLLKELRIDRKASPPRKPRLGLWIGVAVALAVIALAVWLLLGREDAIEVTTAPAVAIGGGGGSTAVLDASGYVVARRMATVSSKITGKC
jgi:hypothetical protein